MPHRPGEYRKTPSFRFVQAQDSWQDTPDGNKNFSDPVGDSLKMGSSGAKR